METSSLRAAIAHWRKTRAACLVLPERWTYCSDGSGDASSAGTDRRRGALRRREFILAGLAACLTTPALASVPTPFAPDLWPDMGSREAFVAWMKAHRGE